MFDVITVQLFKSFDNIVSAIFCKIFAHSIRCIQEYYKSLLFTSCQSSAESFLSKFELNLQIYIYLTPHRLDLADCCTFTLR